MAKEKPVMELLAAPIRATVIREIVATIHGEPPEHPERYDATAQHTRSSP